MKALAIDPGERTGWATGTITPDAQNPLTITSQGVDSVRDFALKLDNLISETDVVIYETWRLYRHKAKAMAGNDMQPSQVVGMVRYVCWQHPHIKIVSQGAKIKNTALKTMPKELQEHMSKSSEQHDQDALMHLWYYTWRNYYEPQ